MKQGKQMITTERIGTRAVKGDANGPVTTYFLSAEELEKYRAMPSPQKSKGYETLATQHKTGDTLSKFRSDTQRRRITIR